MSNLNRLSLTDAATGLRNRQFSSRELVQSCLDRIEKREPEIRAWVQINAELALTEADRMDQMASNGEWHGPLHGLPVGIKDIFDVQGFDTQFGSAALAATSPSQDAVSVARLRHAGAIVIGKTVTTAFAMGDPGPTCNPWNQQHTPGGSSSGSAAAVADGMCLAALGTQTAGSVIRPCAFNGLAGIKPGYEKIDIRGVLPLSWQLDHIGALTRDLEDADLIWQVLRDDRGWQTTADYDGRLPSLASQTPVRIWRCRGLFEELASQDSRVMMDEHCEQLARHGVEIIERELPDSFNQILDMHKTIMAAEAAASHRQNFASNASKYPPRIKEMIENGQTITASDYIQAVRHRLNAIDDMANCMMDVDATIMPAAAGAAPAGLEYTGDRSFNAPSSYLGFPVVSYAFRVDADNLPLAMQLMGRPNSEDALLEIGGWCERLCDFTATTPE